MASYENSQKKLYFPDQRYNGGAYKNHTNADSIYPTKGGGFNSQNHHNNENEINGNLETSWIYALCMRCRVEYNTPSWEPPHWQKVCPYPLCPSFRQFARIVSIILIGEYLQNLQ